jgi:hypothetical protein
MKQTSESARLRQGHFERAALFERLLKLDGAVQTWDVVVLLVQDGDQKKQFDEDVRRLVKLGKIPAVSHCHVVEDGAKKCGNGGAIITTHLGCLLACIPSSNWMHLRCCCFPAVASPNVSRPCRSGVHEGRFSPLSHLLCLIAIPNH